MTEPKKGIFPSLEAPPYQERALTEKRELDEKRTKLAAFIVGPIFSALDETDRDLLSEQADIMYEYSDVLRRRIDRFEP